MSAKSSGTVARTTSLRACGTLGGVRFCPEPAERWSRSGTVRVPKRHNGANACLLPEHKLVHLSVSTAKPEGCTRQRLSADSTRAVAASAVLPALLALGIADLQDAALQRRQALGIGQLEGINGADGAHDAAGGGGGSVQAITGCRPNVDVQERSLLST